QVLINLGNNAVKFTRTGQIVIKLERLETREDGMLMKFSVADTGIGMTPGQVSKLFRSFSQADVSTTRKYGGTGLGLSICKRLVEMMNGEIRAESAHGEGSTFYFTVEVGLETEARKRTYACPGDLKDFRVLVVDDNESARKILVNALESFSLKADQAASGKEALERLRAAAKENAYRLVLMDWKMPEMDGIEASKRIKGDEALARIPSILMVTAYSREEIRKKAQSVGIDAFLIKPVTISLLFDTIMEVFGKSDDDRSLLFRESSEEVAGLDGVRGAKILLVEDNEINQQVAVELLESERLMVDVAVNGEEALKALRATPADAMYDLVLMDVQMPVLDGYQATRRIRDDLGMKDLPVIAMTAHAMEEERKKCLR
ncbi:MAG: response regulator, partial [Desulfobacterales bacterium]|nr:response regulator [Desulfobacterales bacterium]